MASKGAPISTRVHFSRQNTMPDLRPFHRAVKQLCHLHGCNCLVLDHFEHWILGSSRCVSFLSNRCPFLLLLGRKRIPAQGFRSDVIMRKISCRLLAGLAKWFWEEHQLLGCSIFQEFQGLGAKSTSTGAFGFGCFQFLVFGLSGDRYSFPSWC